MLYEVSRQIDFRFFYSPHFRSQNRCNKYGLPSTQVSFARSCPVGSILSSCVFQRKGFAPDWNSSFKIPSKKLLSKKPKRWKGQTEWCVPEWMWSWKGQGETRFCSLLIETYTDEMSLKVQSYKMKKKSENAAIGRRTRSRRNQTTPRFSSQDSPPQIN